VGGGSEASAISDEIKHRGLAERVTMLGAVPHAKLADYYRAADLTVLPSLSEGVPNVLMESIACGTPFVASNVGGIPEIADPDMDCLVPPADPPALARGIEQHLNIKRCDCRRARRFEPMTVSESARRLSRVL